MKKQQAQYAVVIGGINMDISGTPYSSMISGDSNPGRIELSPGGVGRNIAQNIVRLGIPVHLISALGEDTNGKLLRDSCNRIGIDTSACITIQNAATSTYLCLNDADGEILGAISDMSIYEKLTPDVLQPYRDLIAGAWFIVMDANIRPETLEAVTHITDAPIFADPVSVKKAGRLTGILNRCTMIKPNLREALLLTGISIQCDEDLQEAASVLMARGVTYPVVSLGARGVYWNDGKSQGIMPCPDADIVNTSGCGDAFLAAAAVSCMKGLNVRSMMAYGLAASAVTAASRAAVNSDISWGKLTRMLQKDQQEV